MTVNVNNTKKSKGNEEYYSKWLFNMYVTALVCRSRGNIWVSTNVLYNSLKESENTASFLSRSVIHNGVVREANFSSHGSLITNT